MHNINKTQTSRNVKTDFVIDIRELEEKTRVVCMLDQNKTISDIGISPIYFIIAK